MLAHLTNITSRKVKFKWTKIEQDAFEEIERIVGCNNLLAYTYFNEEFRIHTDASNFQLVEVIKQNGKPVYLNSIKLTVSQKRYTLT